MKHSIPHMRKTATGWSYNPPWVRECEAPKVSTMPKPRVEGSAKTVARLLKIKGDGQSAVGRRAGDYYLAATDGHRALLLPRSVLPVEEIATVQESKALPDEFCTLPPNTFVTGAWFHLALRRALVIASDREGNDVSLTINPRSVTVAAEYEGDTFSEEITAVVQGESEQIGFNAKYLLDALGVWPLYFHYSDEDNMAVLRPEDDSWRYLLLPLRI